MLKRSAIAGVLAAFGLVALATNAEAARIKTLFDGSKNGTVNTINDQSEEEVIQGDGNTTLDIGDVLRGIVYIDAITNPKFAGGEAVGLGTAHTELSAIFQTMVVGRQDIGSGLAIYHFGPDPAFEATWGTGAMVVMFEDLDPDETISGGPGSGDETNASNGFKFWTLGFLGTLQDQDSNAGNGLEYTDLDEGWQALASTAVPPSGVPSFFFSINRIASGGIADDLTLGTFDSFFGSNGPVEFRGTGRVNPPRSGSGWPLSNGADFEFKLIVPLPAAAWAGFAMLGLIGVGRKLRRRSA